MFSYGKSSQKHLNQTTDNLALVFRDALATGLMDISVFESIRSKDKQTEYYQNGKSGVQWPNGKHNVLVEGQKSRAVDAAPFINGKISWNKFHCIGMAYIILTCAKLRGVNIRWGGNWDQDTEPITDQDFQDLVHFEEV